MKIPTTGIPALTAALIGAALIGAALLAPVMAQQSPSSEAPQARQTDPDLVEFDKQAAQVQANFQKMQEQMDRVRQTRDPVQREKLLQEHWTTMQSAMGTMQGMSGPGLMGGRMMGGHMMNRYMMGGAGGPTMDGPMMGWGRWSGYYNSLTPEQLRQRQYMMDQYMGLQHQMMSHMLWHQNYRWTPPPGSKGP